MNSRILHARRITLLALALALAPAALRAEVTRVEITSRTDVLGGKSFGEVGPYEKLVGKIYFALDPQNPHNKTIVDLDKAPRNGQGKVEFSADLVVLRPKDPSRGNGVLFFDIVNRGNGLVLGSFNRGTRSANSPPEAEYGDGLLMREGYTIVAVGWELALPNGLTALYPPIATDNGRPITGWISNWFIPTGADPTFQLTSSYWTGFRAYPPLDPENPEYRLTERLGFYGEPRVVTRENWQFGRIVGGKLVYDPQYLFRETRFNAGYTYELRYQTKDPRVAGLGFAAVRDAASAFKYNRDGVITGRYAYAFGASQTGRYLRAFLHEGFNTDERDRQALDAVFIHTGSASLGSFNERFAQPNEGGFFSTSPFPYLYEVTKDPVTGKMDGLGARVPAGQHPKVFITNSSFEYWGNGRAAALNHIALEGRQDLPLPENVRVYLLAGAQHGAGAFPPPDTGAQLKGNSNDYRWALRALLGGMDRWVRKGEAPGPSQIPKFANQTLVAQSEIKFPRVPGIQWPYKVAGGYRSDLPGPPLSHPLPFFVPEVDSDGNETSGIRLPDVAVPLATYTGWAFRSERIGAPTELLPLIGSYIPFARTRVEREKSGDPRPSVAERYASRADYLRRIDDAARQLVNQRYALQEDVGPIVDRAARHWDLLLGAGKSSADGK